MSIFVAELVDGILAIEHESEFTATGARRTHPESELRARIRRYVAHDGIGDLTAIVREARRLADDLRLRTGEDHSDPGWAEVESVLHPFVPSHHVETYARDRIVELIPKIATQIDEMEMQLAALTPRAA